MYLIFVSVKQIYLFLQATRKEGKHRLDVRSFSADNLPSFALHHSSKYGAVTVFVIKMQVRQEVNQINRKLLNIAWKGTCDSIKRTRTKRFPSLANFPSLQRKGNQICISKLRLTYQVQIPKKKPYKFLMVAKNLIYVEYIFLFLHI